MKIYKNKTFWFIILSIVFICSQISIIACIDRDSELILLDSDYKALLVENKKKTESLDDQKIEAIKNIISNSDDSKTKLKEIKKALKHDNYFWYFVGFLGEALFGSRMFVQWIASEKAKRNVIPVSFWYLSLSGSTLVFSYAIQLGDPVFILSKGAGFFIYIRNIILLLKEKKTKI